MTTDQETLEARLRDALRQRAEATPLGDDDEGGAGAPPRLGLVGKSGRREARPAAAVVAGVAAAVAAAVVLVALVGRDGPGRVRTVGPAEETQAPPTTPPPATTAEGPVPPRLLLDVPGATVTRVSDEQVDPVPQASALHLRAYRVAGQATPLLFVEDVPAGYPFGFGEASPSAERRTVDGRLAYLHGGAGPVSLGVPAPGGGGRYLVAFGLTADEVVAAAEVLARDRGQLPGGLALSAEGDVGWPAGRYVEVGVTLPDGRSARLTVQPAGPMNLEDRVQDRVASARSVEEISVLGRPAVLVVYDAPSPDSTLMWSPADGWMAELRAPVDAAGLRDLAAAVRQVDEAAWAAAAPR